MQNINFKHYYLKLYFSEFTTVRGKYQFGNFSVGESVNIYVNKILFCTAEITKKELKPLKDLSLEFMKLDGEWKDFKINTKQDFVDLLNSFLPAIYQKATLESEKTILYLKTIGMTREEYGF